MPLLLLQLFSTENLFHLCEHGIDLLLVVFNGRSSCGVAIKIMIEKLRERYATETSLHEFFDCLDEFLEVLDPYRNAAKDEELLSVSYVSVMICVLFSCE